MAGRLSASGSSVWQVNGNWASVLGAFSVSRCLIPNESLWPSHSAARRVCTYSVLGVVLLEFKALSLDSSWLAVGRSSSRRLLACRTAIWRRLTLTWTETGPSLVQRAPGRLREHPLRWELVLLPVVVVLTGAGLEGVRLCRTTFWY